LDYCSAGEYKFLNRCQPASRGKLYLGKIKTSRKRPHSDIRDAVWNPNPHQAAHIKRLHPDMGYMIGNRNFRKVCAAHKRIRRYMRYMAWNMNFGQMPMKTVPRGNGGVIVPFNRDVCAPKRGISDKRYVFRYDYRTRQARQIHKCKIADRRQRTREFDMG
jgi:hypothetical protein